MCECEEVIDKGICNKGFIWNPRNCKWECDKSCDIGEYLDYSNCRCREKLVDKLIEEYTKNINEVEITEITQDKNKYSSCTIYIVLFSIFFTINVETCTYFIYYKYMNGNKENDLRYDYTHRAKNY